MTLVSVMTSRRGARAPAGGLCRRDLLRAVRQIALDLDLQKEAHARFEQALGKERCQAVFEALRALVLTLCCHGRRPFPVGHPRNPFPTPAERHLLALLAAHQTECGEEVEIRLATLLRPGWRAAARGHVEAVADGLAEAGAALAVERAPCPLGRESWAGAAR